jgi:Putative restriction endonuclease
MMSQLQTQLLTDIWVTVAWDEYIEIIKQPEYELAKRMLYEELGVSEYWIVDVQKAKIIAFKIIANRGSERLTESEVLPGLKFALLEEGLRRSRETDHTEVGSWFLEEVRQ